MKSGKGNTRNKRITLWVLPLQLAPHQLSFHSEFSKKSDLVEALGWESWLRQGFLTIHKQRNHLETFKCGFNWRPGEELPGANAAGPGCRSRAKELPLKSGCGDRVPHVPSRPRIPTPSQASLTATPCSSSSSSSGPRWRLVHGALFFLIPTASSSGRLGSQEHGCCCLLAFFRVREQHPSQSGCAGGKAEGRLPSPCRGLCPAQSRRGPSEREMPQACKEASSAQTTTVTEHQVFMGLKGL